MYSIAQVLQNMMKLTTKILLKDLNCAPTQHLLLKYIGIYSLDSDILFCF